VVSAASTRGGRTRVAVVGLGATGVMITIRIIQEILRQGAQNQYVVEAVDDSAQIGTGVAYGTSAECHVLNMRPEAMSIDDADPNDFVDWLEARYPNGVVPQEPRVHHVSGPERTPDSAVPRRYFAHYLRERFARALSSAESARLPITVVRDRVVACRPEDAGVTLVLQDGNPIHCDRAILCLGDLPGCAFPALRGHARFIDNPWDLAAYDRIPPSSSVAVIGAGLTGIDVLLHLRARGHQGPITCLTRRSGFPKVQPVRRDNIQHEPRVATLSTIRYLTRSSQQRLTLEQARDLIVGEIEASMGSRLEWNYDPERLTADFSAEMLRADIKAVSAGEVRWYSGLVSTWRTVPHIWNHLEDEHRRQFMRLHYSHWGMFRHCMPLRNALRIHELFSSGQLTGKSGLRHIVAEQAQLRIESVGRARMTAETVDYVIDATGTGYDLGGTTSALLRDLIGTRNAVQHVHGGIDVDFESMRLRQGDGALSSALYFIGPLTRGVHFYTTGVDITREHSRRLVSHMFGTVPTDS